MNGTWAVILAGGSGTRFWPASTPALPKQCLDLDGRSLLQHTVDRLDGIPPERVLVVTGRSMEAAVRAQLPQVPETHIVVEPSGRNTAPAVALGVREVQRRGGEVMIVLPADHRIGDVGRFREVLRAAVAAARTTSGLVLLGQPADRAATGFGWIIVGERVEAAAELHWVDGFIEKPDADTAVWLLDAGALWNGGMFVWTVPAIVAALEACLPQTWDAVLADDWEATEPVSIDVGVLQKATRLAVMRCDFGWSDLGSWPAMEGVLPDHALGSARVAGGVALDGGHHIVDVPDKIVATLGVSDLVIVEANGVLLVAARDQAQRIGEVIAALDAERDK